MATDEHTKEREILLVMRKVLAAIIKDTTPPSRAMKHPLSDATINDVRGCLGLISARERELADQVGVAVEKPYFSDDKSAAEVVSISTIGRSTGKKDDAV